MDSQKYAFPESIKTTCSQNEYSSVLRLTVQKLAFPAKNKFKLQLTLWFRESPKAAGWIIQL